jgi:hypothetical protein
MPAGAQTHRLINSSKPMSFTITTDRATTPRARTLLDIFRHKRNRPNRLPRSPHVQARHGTGRSAADYPWLSKAATTSTSPLQA